MPQEFKFRSSSIRDSNIAAPNASRTPEMPIVPGPTSNLLWPASPACHLAHGSPLHGKMCGFYVEARRAYPAEYERTIRMKTQILGPVGGRPRPRIKKDRDYDN